jgi:hypothetical protein
LKSSHPTSRRHIACKVRKLEKTRGLQFSVRSTNCGFRGTKRVHGCMGLSSLDSRSARPPSRPRGEPPPGSLCGRKSPCCEGGIGGPASTESSSHRTTVLLEFGRIWTRRSTFSRAGVLPHRLLASGRGRPHPTSGHRRYGAEPRIAISFAEASEASRHAGGKRSLPHSQLIVGRYTCIALVPVFPPSVTAPPGRKIRPPITALPLRPWTPIGRSGSLVQRSARGS